MQLSFWGKILFTVFIMNCNRSYAAGCPKRTYLLNAHFVSMSTQAVCNSVAVILILKLCSERKREKERKEGRKERKIILTEFLSSTDQEASKSQLQLICFSSVSLTASCPLLLTAHFPMETASILRWELCYLLVKASPEVSPTACFIFRCICPKIA